MCSADITTHPSAALEPDLAPGPPRVCHRMSCVGSSPTSGPNIYVQRIVMSAEYL